MEFFKYLKYMVLAQISLYPRPSCLLQLIVLYCGEAPLKINQKMNGASSSLQDNRAQIKLSLNIYVFSHPKMVRGH